MRGLSSWFMLSAIVYVIAGMLFGIHMSISGDHTLAPAHAHLNLIGWVSMAVFGIYYHIVPAAAAGMLARVHFWLTTAAIWTFIPGIAMAILETGETLVKIGSLLAVATMVLFFVIVFRHRNA